MATRSRPMAHPARLPLILLLAFLVVCAFGGGGSRVDVQSQMLVRVAAILLVAALALFVRPLELDRVRAPLTFAAICAAVVIVQLIPLPPAWWLALPGRELYAEAALASGQPQPWRPISLTPDLTVNTLLSLLPPAAALVGFAALRREDRQLLLPILLGIALLSAVFGVLQVSAGGAGLSLYRIWNEGAPVGLFANRNHQAILLALTLPMLAAWAALPVGGGPAAKMRPWLAVCCGLFLLPLILVTGSRGGLLLAALGLLLAVPLAWAGWPRDASGKGGKRKLLLGAGAAAVLLALGGLTLYLSRAEAIERLLGSSALDDVRVQLIAPMKEMIGTFFPWGSGFGSFDSVFRRFEPFELLNRAYYNHAHNDLLELLSDAGLAGAALLLIFLLWWGRCTLRLWLRPERGSFTAGLGRLGSVMTLMLLVASLVDYPLRTPLLALFFALACGWIAVAARGAGVRQEAAPLDR